MFLAHLLYFFQSDLGIPSGQLLRLVLPRICVDAITNSGKLLHDVRIDPVISKKPKADGVHHKLSYSDHGRGWTTTAHWTFFL